MTMYQPKSEGFTPLPNFLIDERYIAELPHEAVTLLIVLNRHIRGYRVEEKAFTTSLAMQLAGFKDERTASKYLKLLVDWKLATVKKQRGKASIYRLNFDNPKPTQYLLAQQVGTSNGVTPPTYEDGGRPTCDGGLIKKPNKKNNTLHSVLHLWQPNLETLNTWLKFSGESEMDRKQIEHTLLEVNAHYEEKIKSGRITENQMYANFIKWKKRTKTYAKACYAKPTSRMQELEALRQQGERKWLI